MDYGLYIDSLTHLQFANRPTVDRRLWTSIARRQIC